MNTQIFLRLIRTGDFSPTAGMKDVMNWISPVTKAVIAGDALEVPFLKWIRVTGMANSIGFSSGTIRSINKDGDLVEKSYGEGGSYHEALHTTTAATQRSYGHITRTDDFGAGNTKTTHYSKARATDRFGASALVKPKVAGEEFTDQITRARRNRRRPYIHTYGDTVQPAGGIEFDKSLESSPFFTRFQNSKLKIKLPDHESLTFTKNCDNGTPQLAFAASAQEPIKHALFAFRRRIGNGVQGIRVPFMIIWLRECLITGWELDGDTEKVQIKYKKIKWCTYDQVTDWNAPTGMSNRDWDTQDQAGGEDIKTYLIMAAIAAATAGLGIGLSVGLPGLSSTYVPGDRATRIQQIE